MDLVPTSQTISDMEVAAYIVCGDPLEWVQTTTADGGTMV